MSTIKSRIMGLSDLNKHYEAWLETNASRNPTGRSAMEWKHQKDMKIIEQLAELVQDLNANDHTEYLIENTLKELEREDE